MIRDHRTRVVDFLRDHDLLARGEDAPMTPLDGGVSSDLWKVDLPSGTICVKGALARLKVAGHWSAPVSRNRVEYDYLRFAASVCPGQVPRVVADDPEAGLFAMEYLPPDRYPVWKPELLSGRVDPGVAARVGVLVGRLHAAAAGDPDSAKVFATDDNFDALRLSPFLHDTARSHPDLRQRFEELAERTAGIHLTVVHGDVSPKNILLGSRGPVLLDAECAWYGDPAFDVAFCINHLLLKAVRSPGHAVQLRLSAQALVSAYADHVEWEGFAGLDERVATLQPALALARVDGTSPVEYLDHDQRDRVRAIGRGLMADPASNIDELLEVWAEGMHS